MVSFLRQLADEARERVGPARFADEAREIRCPDFGLSDFAFGIMEQELFFREAIASIDRSFEGEVAECVRETSNVWSN